MRRASKKNEDPEALLRRLERLKLAFGASEGEQKAALLRKLRRVSFRRAKDLSRFHELLCFARAYPDSAAVLEEVESMLDAFERRNDLKAHRAALADTGIAGTELTYTFFAPTAVWLTERFASQLSIDWESLDDGDKLRRWLPLLALETEQPGLDEDEATEREWLERLRGPSETDAAFLVRRFMSLEMGERAKEVAYEDLAVLIRLAPGRGTPSRTRARYARSRVVYQKAPLVQSRPRLSDAIRRAPLSVREVSAREGGKLIDLAREAMVTRLRDLDAFAYGDPEDVRVVDCGDGLELASIGAVPERRLLLEAVYGMLLLRNGVPIGYALASALFRSSEVAYNVFDTFRGAEAAWVYGRILGAVHHLFGSDAFTVYPYQLGHDNDEGLSSGAWWFYQKLGFLPRDPRARRVMKRELERMRRRPGHRSSLETLKTLASKNVYYFLGPERSDVIGRLPLSNVGLAVTRYLSRRFGSRREEARTACAKEAAELLGGTGFLSPGERLAWERWSPLILSLPGASRWSTGDKRSLVDVVRAKGGRREADYLVRFDRHRALKDALTALARRASR